MIRLKFQALLGAALGLAVSFGFAGCKNDPTEEETPPFFKGEPLVLEFCCDPQKPFPQYVGVVTLTGSGAGDDCAYVEGPKYAWVIPCDSDPSCPCSIPENSTGCLRADDVLLCPGKTVEREITATSCGDQTQKVSAWFNYTMEPSSSSPPDATLEIQILDRCPDGGSGGSAGAGGGAGAGGSAGVAGDGGTGKEVKPEFQQHSQTLGPSRIETLAVPGSDAQSLASSQGLYGYLVDISPSKTVEICVSADGPTAINYFPKYPPGFDFVDTTAGCTQVTNIDATSTNTVLVELSSTGSPLPNVTIQTKLP